MTPENGNRKGLVLEGGGLRCCFTCGVLDVLMENNLAFDMTVGVSAGALFGCNYKSLQKGRGLRYNLRFKDGERYMGWKSLIRTGDYVNAEFSYHTLPEELDRFDYDTFRSNPMSFYVVCTDISKGQPVYHQLNTADRVDMEWLRASGSMPLFARPVIIDGMPLLDGGLADSIPVAFAERQGLDAVVVVLTQPYGYRKKPFRATFLFRWLMRKYPHVASLMANRHEMYNAQISYIEEEERKGNLLVIRPDSPLNIGRIEQNADKMKAAWQMGVQATEARLEALKSFVNHID